MVKPLSFKGDKKTKKRKHHESSLTVTNEDESSVAESQEHDSWTSPANASELTGPTVIVLPTKPPTCLASDLNGNVYASQLENMVENDPKTAEPHNVQQVWVAARVAGMGSNEITFKASHGGYLSCDQYGILGAKREARGLEESFAIETITDETGKTWYQLQTAVTKEKPKPEDTKYLCAVTEDTTASGTKKDMDKAQKKVSIALRGDGERFSEDTHLILRMQSKFKPQTAEAKEVARSKEKISRQQLEGDAGRKLNDEEAKRLKRARRDGTYQEAVLDVRAKGKHDKYA